MTEIWSLLKLALAVEQAAVNFQKWLIARQKEETQAALHAACTDYKGAATDADRLAAARKLQDTLRSKK